MQAQYMNDMTFLILTGSYVKRKEKDWKNKSNQEDHNKIRRIPILITSSVNPMFLKVVALGSPI